MTSEIKHKQAKGYGNSPAPGEHRPPGQYCPWNSWTLASEDTHTHTEKNNIKLHTRFQAQMAQKHEGSLLRFAFIVSFTLEA